MNVLQDISVLVATACSIATVSPNPGIQFQICRPPFVDGRRVLYKSLRLREFRAQMPLFFLAVCTAMNLAK